MNNNIERSLNLDQSQGPFLRVENETTPQLHGSPDNGSENSRTNNAPNFINYATATTASATSRQNSVERPPEESVSSSSTGSVMLSSTIPSDLLAFLLGDKLPETGPVVKPDSLGRREGETGFHPEELRAILEASQSICENLQMQVEQTHSERQSVIDQLNCIQEKLKQLDKELYDLINDALNNVHRSWSFNIRTEALDRRMQLIDFASLVNRLKSEVIKDEKTEKWTATIQAARTAQRTGVWPAIIIPVGSDMMAALRRLDDYKKGSVQYQQQLEEIVTDYVHFQQKCIQLKQQAPQAAAQ